MFYLSYHFSIALYSRIIEAKGLLAPFRFIFMKTFQNPTNKQMVQEQRCTIYSII